MIFLTILMINAISASVSEWVEIPQAAVSLSAERIFRKSDNSLYVYPTTTSRAHTPILAKPATSSKKSQSKSNKTNNRNNNNKNNKNLRGKNDVPQSITHIKANRTNSSESKINKKSSEKINKPNNYKFDDNNDFAERYSEDEEEEVQVEEEVEEQYSYASFVPYLSTIQSTLMRNTHQNKKSKLNVLKNLRDQLLYEIQNRIASIWKPKGTTKAARHFPENSNNVEFPSNEAALMTIGFLTFAVFLIKLVLKIVQAINYKINMQDQSAALFGRRRREAFDSESIKILNYIDQYTFK